MFDFGELEEMVQDGSFEEIPVEIEEFAASAEYLGFPPLSEDQIKAARASTQIFKKETLFNEIYPNDPEKAQARWDETNNEIVLCWGKGSGKDALSTISCAYIVYQLLCLKDPQKYFGKPPGDFIDIMNIAINAQQASNVFFKGLRARIRNCPWFAGKFQERQGEIEFEKHIRIISGHSESESLEGYNVLVVVLDEIDGFAAENTGTQSQKTAEAIYKMHRASVDSRFGTNGKVVMLSFPRTKEGYIMQKYKSLIAELNQVNREHVFKLDPDLPDGTENNEILVQWTEDHVIRYTRPHVYVHRRPTWEVNPTKNIEDFALSFFNDLNTALGKFCAEPVDAVEGFFKDHDKIGLAFSARNGVNNETGKFEDWFQPQPDKKYFVHVDLAKKHDRAAVAIAHVEKWVQLKIAGKTYGKQPQIVVDAVRWWTPRPNKDVDFNDVSNYIVSLHQRGFKIGMVTFDRWRSDDMIQYLNSINLKAEVHSVLKPEYQDLSLVLQEERLIGPNEDLIITELKQLVLLPNDKIEHPRKGSKDAADAIAGAAFGAIKYTDRESDDVVEVYTYGSVSKREQPAPEDNVIRAPRGTSMPQEIADWISGIEAI